MPISRMQQPRQLYGLGSIVKSIGRAAKKAVKSDLGKAAIAAAGIYTLGGGAFGGLRAGAPGFSFSRLPGASFFGTGSFNPLRMGAEATSDGVLTQLSPFGKALSKIGLATAEGGGSLTRLGKAAAFVGAPAIAGGMFTAKEQEDIEQLRESGDPEALKSYLRRYYRNLNPNADQIEIENFVRTNAAEGGRMKYAMGDTAEDNAMQASGIMGLPLNENPAGVTELDLRETGGFIPPVGVKEKADDIPAMLSNNEFVFTADAVRGMGDGDVNRGAQRMYAMMKKLEDGGRV